MAVPNPLDKDWLRSYETLAPMVVPRSSTKLAQDEEFTLYNVTLFKKHVQQFIQKARANRFVPREFTWTEHGGENAKKELDNACVLERKLWSETLRLARTAWSDEFMAWIHIKALRVYVESVLRYGLPLEYISAIIKVSVVFFLFLFLFLLQRQPIFQGKRRKKSKKKKRGRRENKNKRKKGTKKHREKNRT